MAFNPSYVCKSRHGVYYLRYPIPVQYHPKSKRDYIKMSLQTYVKHEALIYANMMRYIGDVMLRKLQGVQLDYIDKKRMIAGYFQEALAKEKDLILKNGLLDREHAREMERGIGALESYEVDDLHVYSGIDREGLEMLADRCGVPLPDKAFESEFNKHLIDFTKSLLKFNNEVSQAGYGSTEECITIEPSTNTVTVKDTLVQVVDKYFDEHRHWSDATKTSYQTYSNLLLEDFRDVRVSQFSMDIARRVKSKVDAKKCNVKTKNEYISFYSSFFLWAKNNGYTDQHYFNGMAFKLPLHEQGKARDAFTRKELQVLFEKLTDTGKNQEKKGLKDHQYWSALIAMFSGMRLYEVTQLYRADVMQVQDDETGDHVWVFRVSDNYENQKLKTPYSKRYVPIHSKLIEIGLLDYIDGFDDNERIFPQLTYNANKGSYGKAVGDWFARFLKVHGLKTEKLSFHSLRHSFYTMLRQASVDKDLFDEVVGHSKSGMAKVYHGGYGLFAKQKAVECFSIE